MNCGCPIAPAHDPVMRVGSMSPASTMRSASINSERNIDARRLSCARVASAAMVGRVPVNLPNVDSRPQTETTTDGATP